jgi:hypothetical protein
MKDISLLNNIIVGRVDPHMKLFSDGPEGDEKQNFFFKRS